MAKTDDFLLKRSTSFELDATTEARADLSLSQSASTTGNIQGLVTNGGALITGATVKLISGTGEPVAHTETNSVGRYQFSGIPTGTYRVNVALQGFVTSNYTTVLIQSGITKQVDVTLTPESRSRNVVYGIVTNQSTGAFVPDAYVVMTPDLATFAELNTSNTNASGQFIIDQIPDSTQTLGVNAEGFYLADYRSITISGGTILNSDVVLQPYTFPRATVNGYITNQASGSPIANACVGLYSVDSGGMEILQQVTFTDSNGFYLFGRAPAGTYIVKAKSEKTA